MGLAGADRSREEDVFTASDPIAASQVRALWRMNSLGGAEVELIERFHLGEAGGMQPLLDGGLGTRADLDGEHLVQVVLVRPVLLPCLAGEVLEGACEARHLELARLRAKHVGDDGGAAHRAPPRRRS